MVAGGDNALRSDFVGAARLLSIATHKKEMEVVHADRAGDDRLEYHRERGSNLLALAAGQSDGAASVYVDRHPRSIGEGTIDGRAFAT